MSESDLHTSFFVHPGYDKHWGRTGGELLPPLLPTEAPRHGESAFILQQESHHVCVYMYRGMLFLTS